MNKIPALGDFVEHQGKRLLVDQRSSANGQISLWSNGTRYPLDECRLLDPTTDEDDAVDLIDGIEEDSARAVVKELLGRFFEGEAKRALWDRLTFEQKEKLKHGKYTKTN